MAGERHGHGMLCVNRPLELPLLLVTRYKRARSGVICIQTRIRDGYSEFRILVWARGFLISKTPRPCLRLIQPPIQWIPVLSAWNKAVGE